MSERAFVSIGDGLFSDPEDDSVMIINPLAVLQSRDLEVSQESLVAIYSEAVAQAKEADLDLILISNDGVPSTFEVIESSLPEKSADFDSEGKYAGPERRQWPRDKT